mmetsp:Transcript_43327/g.92750  ORF Transcript_43327/g.92750 Transcript_43327/m.92750 type:complete len:200 (-) Transcript_43327:411-1010(-)
MFMVRIGQSHQFLPRWRNLPDGPAFDLFAEGRNREKVDTNHSSDGHFGWVLIIGAVVGGVQCSNTNRVAHRLKSDGLRHLETDADPREVDLLGPKALALQVTPKADLHIVVLLAKRKVYLGLCVRFLSLDILEKVACRLINLCYLKVPNFANVLFTPFLARDVPLLLGSTKELLQIFDDPFGLLALSHGVLHFVRSLLL